VSTSPITLNSLVPDVLSRLEENEENGPIFYSLVNEVLPELVDAMFEASLLTGIVQATNVRVTLPAFQNYFSYSGTFTEGGASITVPAGVVAGLRLKAPYPIRKVSLKGLSDVIPGWQNTAPSQQLRAWFPLGTSGFGIFPALSVESDVVMDFIVSPAPVPRPYNVNIPVPFPEQYTDAFSMLAATLLRSKELGNELAEAQIILNQFLEKMRELSVYQNRLDSLVYTQSSGSQAQTSMRTIL